MKTKVLKLWESNAGNPSSLRAAPGGWVLTEWGHESRMSSVYVPEPGAPHCQPVPPDAPPMTDEALREWLTATHGEAQILPGGLLQWRIMGDTVEYDCDSDRYGWCLPDGTDCRSHIAGPALWAAHKYGAP